MTDDISEILNKKKKRSPSASKYKNVEHDLASRYLGCKHKKALIGGSDSPSQVKLPTVIRAEEVQTSLGTEFPSFVKLLVRSHVASCFWMGLPGTFCKTHLPRKDTTVTLEDESGEQFVIKYLAGKTGLSAGWRNFAVGHKLLEGDVLVFHLMEPNKFKVYIIRANDLTDVDGALSLLNLDALTKQNESENAETVLTVPKSKKHRPKSLPLTEVQKKNKREKLSISIHQLPQSLEQSGNESEEVGSEVLEGSKFSGTAVRFKDIKSFEDFHIMVNGMCIDSEIPKHIQIKYYELCRSKNAYLHDRLLPGLCCTLVAGIIFEIVNIADAIRVCKLTTSRYEFSAWEKSLKSFELLGMNVGFIRSRVRWLLSLAFDSEGGASDTKRYLEAKTERSRAENEIKNLEAKLLELREVTVKSDANIETLKSKAESYELNFKKEVSAPW
ncbi:unnamed protein product [Ilex paraguariensis]